MLESNLLNMSEVLVYSPMPPTRFSSETGVAVSVTSKDALGESLVRDEAVVINQELIEADGEADRDYWDEVRQFYGISDEDSHDLILYDVATKYDFSPENRENIMRRNVGGFSLRQVRKRADIDASFKRSLEHKECLDADIVKIREGLRELLSRPGNDKVLDAELGLNKNLPAIFHYWRLQSDKNTFYPWHEWLVDKATPAQFMNFVQWHNHQMNEINQDIEVIDEVIKQKQAYKAMLEKFSAQKLINLRNGTLFAVNSVRVVMADIFSTSLRKWDGYCVPQPSNSSKWVAVNPQAIKTATKHELNHAVLGEFKDRWLNEATTEHISVAMERGVMHETSELMHIGVYNEERYLLNVVMNKGPKTISEKTLLQGYTEHKLKGVKDTFTKAVDEAWGEGALEKIQVAIEFYEDEFKRQGRPEKDAQAEAVMAVASSLLERPRIILGPDYTIAPKPKPLVLTGKKIKRVRF